MTYAEAKASYEEALTLKIQATVAVNKARENKEQAEKNLSEAATTFLDVQALVRNRYASLVYWYEQEQS
jgi:hypothetical protein